MRAKLGGGDRRLHKIRYQTIHTRGGSSTVTMLELHRSRVVEWQPSAVVALAVAPGGATVALARETGEIEGYDTTDWRCSARIPGHTGAAVSRAFY